MTISPTHIPGKKEYAWKNFLSGGYVAIGFMHGDLTGKTLDEVISIIRLEKCENEASAIESFTKFLSLNVGDYVAVNNTNHGLFGIGVVTSAYRFQKFKHDTGADDQEGFYSHFREVEWKYSNYVRRKDLLSPGETAWQPYGTVGIIQDEVPPYIKRLLGETLPEPAKIKYVVPDYLKSVVRVVEQLKDDPNHQERAHESLVEDFFCAIGYEKHKDIKYRQGRMDISIWDGNNPLVIVEVKRDWNIYNNRHGAVEQAYKYALDQGMRYVLVTNGDYYVVFDRLKGLSYNSNVIGEFRITALEEEHLTIINRLKRENLIKPNLEELFMYLSESFKQ
jgi:hypothetical protein